MQKPTPDALEYVLGYVDLPTFTKIRLTSRDFLRISKRISWHFLLYRSQLERLLALPNLSIPVHNLIFDCLENIRKAQRNSKDKKISLSEQMRLAFSENMHNAATVENEFPQLIEMHIQMMITMRDISNPCLVMIYLLDQVLKTPPASNKLKAISHIKGVSDDTVAQKFKGEVMSILKQKLSIEDQLNALRKLIVHSLREISAQVDGLFVSNRECRLTKIKLLEMARYINFGRALSEYEYRAFLFGSDEDGNRNALICMGVGTQADSIQRILTCCVESVRQLDQVIVAASTHFKSKAQPQAFTVTYNSTRGSQCEKTISSIKDLNELVQYRAFLMGIIEKHNVKLISDRPKIKEFCDAFKGNMHTFWQHKLDKKVNTATKEKIQIHTTTEEIKSIALPEITLFGL